MTNIDFFARKYTEMYKWHFKKLIEFSRANMSKVFILNFDQLADVEIKLSNRLNEWKFDFKLNPIRELFDFDMLIDKQLYLFDSERIDHTAIFLYNELLQIGKQIDSKS